jgi:hypothetical protein
MGFTIKYLSLISHHDRMYKAHARENAHGHPHRVRHEPYILLIDHEFLQCRIG